MKNLLRRYPQMKRLLHSLVFLLALLSPLAALSQGVTASGNDWLLVNENTAGKLLLGTRGEKDINLIANQGGSPVGWSIDGTTGNLSGIAGTETIAADITGDADVEVVIGGSTVATFDSGGLDPGTDGTYDLGSSSLEWENIYIDGSAYTDTIQLGPGNAGFPSIRLEADPDTGFYLGTAEAAVSIAGTTVATFNSGGLDLASGKTLSINGVDVTAGDVLSTSEVTIGTDYTGNPLLRKCVDVGALPNATTTNDAHGISGLASSEVRRAWGWASNGTVALPLPYAFNGTSATSVNIDATNINLSTGANLSTYSGYVCIEYINP